jgi:integrase
MWVTRKAPGDDKSKNYYVINEAKMYFNAYKTAKTHGVQTVDVPKPVQKVLLQYLKLTGCYRRSRGRATLMPLICSYDGAHYTAGGTMTHLLNRAFGKKVSCNIIRHAYISNLYTADVVGMADTAKSMAHAVTTHLAYYRKPVGGAGVTSDSGSDEASSSVIEVI